MEIARFCSARAAEAPSNSSAMRVTGSREAPVRTDSQHRSDLHHSVMFRAPGGLMMILYTSWESSAMVLLRFSVRACSRHIRSRSIRWLVAFDRRERVYVTILAL